MNFNRSTYFIIFSLWLVLVSLYLGFALYYGDNRDESDLYQKFDVHYVDDTARNLTIEEVIMLPEGSFASDKREVHKPDAFDFSVWYKIRNKGPDRINEALNVTIDNPTLDTIHFYIVQKDQVVFEKVLGDTHNAKYDLDHVSPQISLFAGISTESIIYVNIKTTGSTSTPVLIENISRSQFRNSAQLILLGVLLGIGVVMIVYNYFMYRGVSDRSFLFYIFYVASAVAAIGMINGFTFFLLPEDVAIWANKYLIMPVHFYALGFAILFAISFLRFESVKPYFVNLGVKLCYSMIGVGTIAGFFGEAYFLPVYFAFVIVGYIYAFVLMALVIKMRYVWVRYYVLSWVPLLTGTILSVAAFNGGIGYNFLTKNGSLFGVVAEICIIAIALLDRFRANQVDKEYKINHDLTTGLPNQFLLENAISKLVHHRRPMTLIVFEIQQAKDVIPALGQEMASKFLSQLFRNTELFVANLARAVEIARKEEGQAYHIVRLDDAKIATLFVGNLTEEEVNIRISTIRDAISSLINIEGVTLSVSSVAGVASYPSDSPDADQLVLNAVQALAVARSGKNQWARYTPERKEQIQRRFRLAADLQKAIEEDDLELFHQPQIDLISNRVHGSELLLRWNHPVEGFINPAELIELAEETGVIHQLTEWVIVKGFQQHDKLRQLGFEVDVSINISGKDFNDLGLIAHILLSASRHEFQPQTVTFEITESATAADPEHAKNVIAELNEIGYKVAIDDFGTGYSSLDYLSHLPFHELKIDRCFMDIDQSDRNRTITEVTLLLAKRLGVSAVAEGIENAEVASLLKQFGCPIGQGYYFAKPMPFIEYMRWLQEIYKHDSHLSLNHMDFDK